MGSLAQRVGSWGGGWGSGGGWTAACRSGPEWIPVRLPMSMQAEGLGAIMAGKIPGALPNVGHGHRTAETDGRSGLVFCAPPCPLDGRTGIRPYTFAPAGRALPYLSGPGRHLPPRQGAYLFLGEQK